MIDPKFIGMTLAVLGNILISFSLNVQKLAHNRIAKAGGKISFARFPLWWLGLLMMCAGEMGNFSAFSFAPASLIAPLGCVSVVSNLIGARLLLKEQLRKQDIIGCAIAVMSATGIVIVAPNDEDLPELTPDVMLFYLSQPPFIIYICFLFAAIIASLIIGRKVGHRFVLAHVFTTTMLGSLTVMSAKGLSTFIRLSIEGQNQFTNWLTYIVLIVAGVTAVLQIRFLNLAMKHFDASLVNPVVFVFFTIFSIVGSIILYREFYGMAAGNIVLFMLGCVYTFCGVILITNGRSKPPTSPQKNIEVEEITDFSTPGSEPIKVPPSDEFALRTASLPLATSRMLTESLQRTSEIWKSVTTRTPRSRSQSDSSRQRSRSENSSMSNTDLPILSTGPIYASPNSIYQATPMNPIPPRDQEANDSIHISI